MLIDKALKLFVCSVIMCLSVAAQTNGKERGIQNQTLWYDTPAANWLQALPLGNGSLGATVFGGTATERIQFNESSLVTGTTKVVGSYQPFGNIFIHWKHHTVGNYKRMLLLDQALHHTEYVADGIHFKHEYFISHPAKAMVMQISSEKPHSITANIVMKDAHQSFSVVQKNRISFKGLLGNQMKYEAILQVNSTGGRLIRTDSSIIVKNADKLTLTLVAGTSFRPYSGENWLGADPHDELVKRISRVSRQSYQELKKDHVNDFERLFSRVVFYLGETPGIPTNKRIEAYNKGQRDHALETLLFQYGRYLLISSSRKGGLPANLQGIWNDEYKPAWYSQYTTNINVQMNYWPAEVTNLAECHFPLFDWVENLAAVSKNSGDSVLKTTKGWIAYSTNNIMGGPSKWRLHRPGNAWMSQHFWEHYAFTNDTNFLRKRAYPMLKQLVEYWEGHLVERTDGKLVTPDGWSPEHGPHKNESDKSPYPGVSYDQQIVYDLFTNYLDAASVLNVEQSYRKKVEVMRAKLLGPQIGSGDSCRNGWKIGTILQIITVPL
ncbi:glycoside hydrolase family 95 protein [Ginsengibacter hankyongi]|uniref:Glycoside hydrolase family 95 protein n=1 Tax=Ginsengibacter hankyongi TaxID=2607284 RepID=A0A5J5IHT1_9BACT|nr:glycoside hydrolase family 95 protein [Ginsengibacter hankyongi]KAA9040560.1 glycoside hydrolase family 95 protein [Ginsengibacter hankyongi]